MAEVVYLFGAGASHGCADAIKCEVGSLMGHLAVPIINRIHELARTEYAGNDQIGQLVNEVIDEKIDFEHLITFLDQSPTGSHRAFANNLRQVFEEVLKGKLDRIDNELRDGPINLYSALLELHAHGGLIDERLVACLTLNYDWFLQDAVDRSEHYDLSEALSIDGQLPSGDSLPVLSLHGNFRWEASFPVSKPVSSGPLWIPPGIQKVKDRYPFNLIWGRARESLDCDVLRIVGCRLGSNDWDLVSLIFTTRHANGNRRPFRIEVIDSPDLAFKIRKAFPYLDVDSLLDHGELSERIFGTSLDGKNHQEIAEEFGSSHNWFYLWLKSVVERIHEERTAVKIPAGQLTKLLEAS